MTLSLTHWLNFHNSDHFYNFDFFLQFLQVLTILTILTIFDNFENIFGQFLTMIDNFDKSYNCFYHFDNWKDNPGDIWYTDCNSDNWEPKLMAIFVTWQLIVTLDSIRNSCDVFSNFNCVCLILFFLCYVNYVNYPPLKNLERKNYTQHEQCSLFLPFVPSPEACRQHNFWICDFWYIWMLHAIELVPWTRSWRH